MWNMYSGKPIRSLIGHQEDAWFCECVSGTNEKIISAGNGNQILVHSAKTGKLMKTIKRNKKKPVTCLTLNDNEDKLLTGNMDSSIQMFDVKTWKEISNFTLSNRTVCALCLIHNDEYLVVGYSTGLIIIIGYSIFNANKNNKHLNHPSYTFPSTPKSHKPTTLGTKSKILNNPPPHSHVPNASLLQFKKRNSYLKLRNPMKNYLLLHFPD
eukprot:UN31292